MWRWMVCALACGVVMPVWAKSTMPTVTAAQYERIYDQCVDEEGDGYLSNRVIATCSMKVNRAVDASREVLLDEVRGLIRDQYQPAQAGYNEANLMQASQAWEAYAEAKCTVEGYLIGSPAAMLCSQDENVRRLLEEQELLRHLRETDGI